jgi:DNA/RNA-binding domain of Phe-tRNA-synthetase-like protein
MMVSVYVDEGISRFEISVFYATVGEVIVEKDRVDLREYARSLVNNLVSTYSVDRVKDIPIIRFYRDIMWRLGIDPTKVRVSSEALLRRVLRGGSFPAINNVVDACNLASLETLIPISVFDLSKIRGDLRLRKAKPNEVFVSLDGTERLLTGDEVVLADDSGNILNLYPHRDSKIASVDMNTRSVLVIAYGAPGVPQSLVRGAVERSLKYLMMFSNAKYLSDILKAK